METVGKVTVGIIIGALTIFVIALLMPLAYAMSGYFAGWVLAKVFPVAGNWVVAGLNLFGFEIMLKNLPVLGAALGFVGTFFKANQTNKVEK